MLCGGGGIIVAAAYETLARTCLVVHHASPAIAVRIPSRCIIIVNSRDDLTKFVFEKNVSTKLNNVKTTRTTTYIVRSTTFLSLKKYDEVHLFFLIIIF